MAASAIIQVNIYVANIKKLSLKFGLRKGAKPTILPNFPSYLQDHSEIPERLDRDELDLRHLRHTLQLSITEHQPENEQYSISSIHEIQQKYSILNFKEKWIYFRSSRTSLHIFKKLLSDDLLIMSHQIILNEQLNVRCFLNELPIRTRISRITDMR